ASRFRLRQRWPITICSSAATSTCSALANWKSRVRRRGVNGSSSGRSATDEVSARRTDRGAGRVERRRPFGSGEKGRRGREKGGYSYLRAADLHGRAGQDGCPQRPLPQSHQSPVRQARHDHHRLLDAGEAKGGRGEADLHPRLSEQGGGGQELEGVS